MSIHNLKIMNKIKAFDQFTDVRQHEELKVSIPIGLYRHTKITDFITLHIFFDLIYTAKRLRFAVEVAKTSLIQEVEVTKLYHDEAQNLTSYVINAPLKLSVSDGRLLIAELTEYFQPHYYDVYTIEEKNFIPPREFLSGITPRQK